MLDFSTPKRNVDMSGVSEMPISAGINTKFEYLALLNPKL